MENRIDPTIVKQYTAGKVIYSKGDVIQNVGLIIKGRVTLMNDIYVYQHKVGDILGFTEMEEVYQNTYIAAEDVVLCELSFSKDADLREMLETNSVYRGLFVTSVAKELRYLYDIYQRLAQDVPNLSTYITNTYKDYVSFCERNGFDINPSDILTLCENNTSHIDDSNTQQIENYLFLSDIAIDVTKAYYLEAGNMAFLQIGEMLSLLEHIKNEIPVYIAHIKRYVNCFINHTDDCLYRKIALLALQVEQSGGASEELVSQLDHMVYLLHTEEKFFNDYLTDKLSIDRKTMGDLYSTLLTCLKNQDKSLVKKLYEMTKDHEEIINQFSGCFEQVVGYAEYDEEKAKEFKQALVRYINLRDRSSTEDDARELRKILCEHFYAVYELVFIKAYADTNTPRIIELFLDYGLLEERLLTKEQLIFLFNYKETSQAKNVNIYTIRQWLTLVYENKKEPSKNEFDLDFREVVLNLIRERKVQASDMEDALKIKRLKLHYEIKNILRYNQRILSGQISTFVPIMSKDSFDQDISKIVVTSTMIEEKLEELIQLDFSLFYQETLYTAPEQGITKEYIMKEVLPDIILLPSVGANGSMWQEISSKKRDTPARFILPRFTSRDLFDILIKLCGRYRWEICRRLQGGVWNNIQYKSLTSEYMDYIQFFKKNRDLTEEKKEAIKSQLQKARNNAREVFVADYETWIRYESKGGIRLNRLVREIMSTYCPLSRETREALLKQPIYQDSMSRFIRERTKKAREVESHIYMLQKNKTPVPREMEKTLVFYKDL